MTLQRFYDLADRSHPEGCWPWRGHVTKKGYGLFWAGYDLGRLKAAHRFAYALLRGTIPKGATIDHLCRNRSCVNPDHLEPVTNRENVRRGFGPSAVNARKTHCIHGHEFTRENTYIVVSKGARYCRECANVNAARYRAKRRAITLQP